jgi:hypothetical protein
MNRFTRELKVIPRTAWIIAIALYMAITTPIYLFAIPDDKDMSHWPIACKIAFVYGACFFVILIVALIGYIYGDAKRRGMRYVMWTLLAIFIPNSIGVILYFVLRDPLPKPCPNCSQPVKPGHTFCPQCGAATQPTCPNCGKGVEFSWMNCPGCGTKLPAAGMAAPSPRPVG